MENNWRCWLWQININPRTCVCCCSYYQLDWAWVQRRLQQSHFEPLSNGDVLVMEMIYKFECKQIITLSVSLVHIMCITGLALSRSPPLPFWNGDKVAKTKRGVKKSNRKNTYNARVEHVVLRINNNKTVELVSISVACKRPDPEDLRYPPNVGFEIFQELRSCEHARAVGICAPIYFLPRQCPVPLVWPCY